MRFYLKTALEWRLWVIIARALWTANYKDLKKLRLKWAIWITIVSLPCDDATPKSVRSIPMTRNLSMPASVSTADQQLIVLCDRYLPFNLIQLTCWIESRSSNSFVCKCTIVYRWEILFGMLCQQEWIKPFDFQCATKEIRWKEAIWQTLQSVAFRVTPLMEN